MIDLTDREKAIATVSATLCTVTGWWLGVTSVPDQALAVPMEQSQNGPASLAYYPVPTWAPIFTFVVLAIGAYLAWVFLRDPPEDADVPAGDADD